MEGKLNLIIYFDIKQNWKDWRESEIEKDMEFAHPRWPEEEQYLLQEKDFLDDQRPQYFNDFWYVILYLHLMYDRDYITQNFNEKDFFLTYFASQSETFFRSKIWLHFSLIISNF